jgi:DNA-binding CsgD family transcriptional regulator
VQLIEERLNEVTSPFLNRLSSLETIFTPQEIRVSVLTREGRSSQEIADVIMVSVNTVDFHRKQIRKKLGMTGSGRNLRSYLLSLS